MPFFRCSKILGEVGNKKFYNKCSENSRSQIVFQTDVFRKFTLGAPVTFLYAPQKKEMSGNAAKMKGACAVNCVHFIDGTKNRAFVVNGFLYFNVTRRSISMEKFKKKHHPVYTVVSSALTRYKIIYRTRFTSYLLNILRFISFTFSFIISV